MKILKRICLLTAAVMILLTSAGMADRYHVLDAALSMLEEGNPFLTRYNEDTGAGIEARYPLGCPYFWGGRDTEKILEPAHPEQESDYYKTENQDLYGLDCAGFTRWVVEQAGYTPHDSISNLLNKNKYKEYVIYKAAKKTGNKRVEELNVGDILCIQHEDGRYHSAMFIGTLLDYGYTARSLPEDLRPYLHYPLLIHATERAADDSMGLTSVIAAFLIETLSEAGMPEAFISGENRLLNQPEFRDPDKAHRLMAYLSGGGYVLPPAGGDFPDDSEIRVLIGPENVAEDLKDSSVVIATYDAGDHTKGLIGIVGPTRMDYSTVAAKLRFLAAGLSRRLGSGEAPPEGLHNKLILKKNEDRES